MTDVNSNIQGSITGRFSHVTSNFEELDKANYVRVSPEHQRKIYEDFMIQATEELKFKKVSDAFDRHYIQDYIDECYEIDYIKGKILEFGGSGILYSNPKEQDVTICTGLKDQSKDATIQFNILDSETISYKNLWNTFDTIICTQVLNYMYNPLPALENLKRMLKPNGRLIITVSGPCYRDRNSEGFKAFWTERGLRDMCKEVFGEEGITKPKVYGTFTGAINSLLGLKHDNEINKNKTDYNVITGITCIKGGRNAI